MRAVLPRPVQTWFRNYVFGNALYLGVGAVWAYYIYYVFGSQCFKPGEIPATRDVLEQVKVGLRSMPFYTLLPTVTDYIVEEGWTKAYPRVGEVGLGSYALYFVVYMAGVEFGVYWMHRSLHEFQWAYRLLHNDHHKYNKAHTLSPFAGLAFHPIDGILQALPYTLMLFVVPFHYLTHLLLLFLTGVWTNNIHDCLDGKVEPIMGAAYHTIHHTTYKDNYGHYFIYMDWLFGTLVTPEDYTASMKGSKQS